MDPILEKLEEIHQDLKRGLGVLSELRGATMGSWQWDKRTGLLTMYNTEGDSIGVFSVKDSPENSSRERRIDLE